MAHKSFKMKKFLLPIAASFALIVFGCAINNSAYQYPFTSAKIEYAISGTTEGKSTLLVKGDKSVREAHIVFHKPTGDENQNNLYIDAGEFVYSIDLDKKTGTMTSNPLYGMLTKVDPARRQEFLKRIAVGLSPDDAAARELKVVGKETVAGQECEVYETGGFGQICLWNALPLKTSISIPDLGLTNNTVATSVEVNANIPDTAFEVPAGVEIRKVGVDEDGGLAVQPGTATQTQTQE